MPLATHRWSRILYRDQPRIQTANQRQGRHHRDPFSEAERALTGSKYRFLSKSKLDAMWWVGFHVDLAPGFLWSVEHCERFDETVNKSFAICLMEDGSVSSEDRDEPMRSSFVCVSVRGTLAQDNGVFLFFLLLSRVQQRSQTAKCRKSGWTPQICSFSEKKRKRKKP